MANKANLLSIRKQNFLAEEAVLNKKLYLLTYNFLKDFAQILLLKNILIVNKFINFNGNTGILNLSIFFKTSKIDKIVKFLSFKKISKEKKLIYNFLNLTKTYFNKNKLFSIKIKFKVINFYVNKNVIKICIFMLKKYYKSLFERRLKLFIDFSQILTLFYYNYVNSKFIAHNIAIIFSRIKKTKHQKFLSFIKDIINILLFSIPLEVTQKEITNKISGIKFILKGKIKGKTRTQIHTIQVGNLPDQSLTKNIDFAKVALTTVYGVYGIKIWTYRN